MNLNYYKTFITKLYNQSKAILLTQFKNIKISVINTFNNKLIADILIYLNTLSSVISFSFFRFVSTEIKNKINTIINLTFLKKNFIKLNKFFFKIKIFLSILFIKAFNIFTLFQNIKIYIINLFTNFYSKIYIYVNKIIFIKLKNNIILFINSSFFKNICTQLNKYFINLKIFLITLIINIINFSKIIFIKLKNNIILFINSSFFKNICTQLNKYFYKIKK